jgi:hypothetical protein
MKKRVRHGWPTTAPKIPEGLNVHVRHGWPTTAPKIPEGLNAHEKTGAAWVANNRAKNPGGIE